MQVPVEFVELAAVVLLGVIGWLLRRVNRLEVRVATLYALEFPHLAEEGDTEHLVKHRKKNL